MKNFARQPAAYLMAAFAAIAAVALAGCQRESNPVASAPVGGATSSEYPLPAPADDPSTAAATSLKVTVSLSPEMAKKASPNDTVFIFARAANGPRMPLAVVRKEVKDLPVTVVLDDSVAMSPEAKLSSVPEVVVIARVSKSGDAIANAGDLEGASAPVKTGIGSVTVNIASTVTGR